MGFWEPLPHTPGCSGATCPAHEALGEKSKEWLLWQHQVGSYCRKQRKTAENLKFTALCQGEINLLSYFWMQPSSCHLSGDFPVGAVCTSMLGAAPRWVVPFHPLPPDLLLVEVVPDPSLRHGATAPLQPRRPAACPRSRRDSRPYIWHLITGSDDSQVSHCAVIKPQVFIQSLS